jgi:hypothetical protein
VKEKVGDGSADVVERIEVAAAAASCIVVDVEDVVVKGRGWEVAFDSRPDVVCSLQRKLMEWAGSDMRESHLAQLQFGFT